MPWLPPPIPSCLDMLGRKGGKRGRAKSGGGAGGGGGGGGSAGAATSVGMSLMMDPGTHITVSLSLFVLRFSSESTHPVFLTHSTFVLRSVPRTTARLRALGIDHQMLVDMGFVDGGGGGAGGVVVRTCGGCWMLRTLDVLGACRWFYK